MKESENQVGKIQDSETDASKRRAEQLKKTMEEMKDGMDPAMAKILADIEAKNKG